MNFDLDFDFDIDDFDTEIGSEEVGPSVIKPKQPKKILEKHIDYSNAKKLAKKLDLNKRNFCIVDGKFIFGELIEAILIENELKAELVSISTLSMSQENIDSLTSLLHFDKCIDKLDLIISAYYFSHERNGAIKYIYENLNKENKFQLAVTRTHTKVCLIKTKCKKHVIIHGSANLRSSGNYEQFIVENDKELFDFTLHFHNKIISEYKTIKNT